MKITAKAITKELGKIDGNKVSPKLAYYAIVGVAEMLTDRAFRNTNCAEVERPSQVQMRKLAVKLTTVKAR